MEPVKQKHRGSLIVIEGLDRAGKTSQCRLIAETLRDRGHEVKYVKFPNRSTASGTLINSYLQGHIQLDDHAIHLIFSANRWEAAQAIKADVSNGTTVIVDRYSYSGAVYSAAKENPDLSLEWAWQPEVGLPRPDLLLFLSISSEEAAKRGGYGDERYENNAMQTKVRRLFDLLLSMNHGHKIHAVDAGTSINDVAEKILFVTLEHMCANVSADIGQIRSWMALQDPHLGQLIVDKLDPGIGS